MANTVAQFQPHGSNYNAAPGTQSGDGFFGGSPRKVALPQPYQDLAGVFPNLTGTNAALSARLASDLSGQVSPGTLNQINAAASGAGIDTHGINLSDTYGTLGMSPEQLQSQGIGEFSQALPVVSTTQTVSPDVEAQLAKFNADAAAQANAQDQAFFNSVMGLAGSIVGHL